ncbi:V-set domain-containing T-cell activation inhibitor 1-like [Labrus bergylta]|uniref:V-set domain-containing T-cell activation inhibitor 1-like n=1 Tax=Labrus bergylta TaxID=56723 RepID=UPI0009B46C8A
MSGIKRVTFFYVLFYLKGFAKGDTEVCILKESCILPCSFKQGDKVLVHWNQIKGNTLVHSYFYDRDQLERQDESFKGRTSLFQDQISKGNVSLRLTGVKLEDQGRYKCYTSTTNGNKESFVDLNLEAPPSKVGIQQVGNRITCSSEEIYPQPELTWSSSPPTNLTVADTPTVHQKEKLYSINSSLIVQVGVIDLDYSCTISAGRNNRTATLFKPASINISDTKSTIPCTSSNTHFKSLIWTFNHNQNILIQTSAEVPFNISEEWRKHVKDVSESGSLVLQDLTSLQEGIYTCEHSTAEETCVWSTVLRIKESQSTPDVAGITVGVIFLLVVLAICIFFIYKRFKKKRKGDEYNR